MIIMSAEEWKTKSEAWKEGFQDWHFARDMEMTIEERQKKPLDWHEGLKYAATHFTGGVGPMRIRDEDN